MTDPPDEAVVARVLSGRRDDFGVLVDRYQDRMLAYVRYAGFEPGDAADIVQDAFVRAYRHLGRCGDPERFGGWLFKIVRNVCHSARRRRARRRTEPLEPHGIRMESDAPGPHERLEERRTKRRVHAALDRLPYDQREALILMYLQGYSVSEIAELAGASASAIKMRLKRGREALRSLLEDPAAGAADAARRRDAGPARGADHEAVPEGGRPAPDRRESRGAWRKPEGPTPETGAEAP